MPRHVPAFRSSRTSRLPRNGRFDRTANEWVPRTPSMLRHPQPRAFTRERHDSVPAAASSFLARQPCVAHEVGGTNPQEDPAGASKCPRGFFGSNDLRGLVATSLDRDFTPVPSETFPLYLSGIAMKLSDAIFVWQANSGDLTVYLLLSNPRELGSEDPIGRHDTMHRPNFGDTIGRCRRRSAPSLLYFGRNS
jgi:hypothetical protein